MDEQPDVTVITPKRRFALRLPSRSTVLKVALLGGAFGAGAFVAGRKSKNNCGACDTDATETADQPAS